MHGMITHVIAREAYDGGNVRCISMDALTRKTLAASHPVLLGQQKPPQALGTVSAGGPTCLASHIHPNAVISTPTQCGNRHERQQIATCNDPKGKTQPSHGFSPGTNGRRRGPVYRGNRGAALHRALANQCTLLVNTGTLCMATHPACLRFCRHGLLEHAPGKAAAQLSSPSMVHCLHQFGGHHRVLPGYLRHPSTEHPRPDTYRHRHGAALFSHGRLGKLAAHPRAASRHGGSRPGHHRCRCNSDYRLPVAWPPVLLCFGAIPCPRLGTDASAPRARQMRTPRPRSREHGPTGNET